MNTTMVKKDAALVALIADYLKTREVARKGKTARKIKSGYFTRHRLRKGAHESWMHAVANNPNQKHVHPFYV